MPLVGRDDALRELEATLDAVPRRGGVLVIRGSRGCGRSTLLDTARTRAHTRDHTVLSVWGSPAASRRRFAGLHQLLRPLRPDIEALPAAAREPLHAILAQGTVDPMSAGVAVLEALASAATSRPVVVVVDDAHWLDAASQELLAFAGRRIAAVPVALILGTDLDALKGSAFPEIVLPTLTTREAQAMLAPYDLPPRLASAVLAQAEGIPLALRELAREAAVHADALTADAVVRLPVSRRLTELLADRVASLEAEARAVLLAAALEPGAAVDEVLAAAVPRASVADLSATVAAGALDLDAGKVRVTAPLTATAVIALARPDDIVATHTAFATTLRDPRRAAWHRAAVASGPDAGLAAEISRLAAEQRRSGKAAEAVAAYEVAARLSATPTSQAGALLDAAAAAFELGESAVIQRLLALAEQLGPPPALVPLIDWHRRLLRGEWPPPDDAAWAQLLDTLVAGPDPDLALAALMPLAMGCWWSDPSPRARARLRASAAGLARRTASTRADAIAALADPVTSGDAIRRRLAACVAEDLADPIDALHLAIAAQAIGAWPESFRLLAPAVERLRRRGDVGVLAQALIHTAHAAYYTGDWTSTVTLAAESRSLAERAGRPRQAFAAQLLHARAQALTGGRTCALEDAAASAAQTGLGGADVVIRTTRGALALADGDPARAVTELLPLYATPTNVPVPMIRAGWEIVDLIEALTATDATDEAVTRLGAFERHALHHPGGATEAAIACARAMIAAEPVTHDLSPWPYLRARTLLARGARLRRERNAEGVDLLRRARDELLMLGATPFVRRARSELRAAGEAPPVTTDALAELTAHELRIARMAAAGLTNPQIGARLAVSPRTVSSHLYRVFPKLGVSSRGQLRQLFQER